MINQWLSNSDLVLKYKRIWDGSARSAPTVSSVQPHPTITQRLAIKGLAWADLDYLTQQALLWDSGLVRYNSIDANKFTQVYTMCDGDKPGNTMAQIAMPLADFLKSQNSTGEPNTLNCTANVDGTTMKYFRQQNADGGLMQPYTHCAIANITLSDTGIADSHSSMWAQDGAATSSTPLPQVQRHAWNDGKFWLIFAIHTVDVTSETEWGKCPDISMPAGGTYPCQVFDGTAPKGWCLPVASEQMNSWLDDIVRRKPTAIVTTTAPSTAAPSAPSSSSTLSTGAIVGIAVGAAVLLCSAVLCIWMRRRKSPSEDPQSGYIEFGAHRRSSHHNTGTTYPGTHSMNRLNTGTNGSSQQASYQPIHTASHTLNEFQRDPYLTSKRLPYASVVYSRLLSKGAFGEVWLGSFEGGVVAIKRLLDTKRTTEAEIENFADEIRLMASFSHPNIVTFIGFAWDSLQNLCAITEFMPQGDLHTYLRSHLQLQWRRHEKIKIALGIAHALAYLHGRPSAVIHRDLKSKNVLMAAGCEAKLSDFGISRERTIDDTMTAGVGTIFWTAPEVLLGGRYSEQADIYSFGCVLVELDTRQSPYPDLQGVPQATLVHRITVDDLRPSFLSTCPQRIKSLAALCFASDPTGRPSAAQLATILEHWDDPNYNALPINGSPEVAF
ncbi:protein kinase [Achlya hypogyna]|uniref:Protein kinase n=1 Tax=Achlya hypogyna TaxID=1202772 RepID=A0A1V9YKH4_ACHHY|nr:protein kinase [Achlya hypogyna]